MTDMPSHTAEVLRQVQGSGVVRGGWVGGDAWLGSVSTAVELFRRMQVHSTFVVKGNKHLFPMEVLHKVLGARFPERPSGHWVVMKTTISDVKLLAVAYAWSQKGVSYFISTCGSTEISPIKYESKYEDMWGNTATKLINRPELCHFLYEYLPLIDEHNKQRQNLLALEKTWLTKDVWFRLVCTLTGQTVVDMHRYYRHHRIVAKGESRLIVDKLRVVKFSDLLCGTLRQWPRDRQGATQAAFRDQSNPIHEALERIRGKDGEVTRPVTQQQAQGGRTIGSSCVRWCFVCRGYMDSKGKPVQWQTQWQCILCKMPVCALDRKDDKVFGPNGRDPARTCLEIHQSASSTSPFGCGAVHGPKTAFPKQHQINLHPRRGRSGNSGGR
jgi:hypothetical protein